MPTDTPTTRAHDDVDAGQVDLRVVAKALTPPEPVARAAPAVAVDHPESSDEALSMMLRSIGKGMLIWMVLFAALAAVARVVAPQLQDLDAASTATFIAMCSGFGIIPGMVIGLGKVEDAFERH